MLDVKLQPELAIKASFSSQAALNALGEDGYCLFPAVIPAVLLSNLQEGLKEAVKACYLWQEKQGLKPLTGVAHHVLGSHPVFLQLLQALLSWTAFHALLLEAFDGLYCLNSYGGLDNPPQASSYLQAHHRDIRFFSAGKPLMVNVLLMLDTFTLENGPTLLLKGSHKTEAKPETDTFLAEATPVTGPAGSVLLFDSRLWHRAGSNQSQQLRRALTLTLTRPFFKPQFQYHTIFSEQMAASFSPELRQLLGMNARIPASLEQWYQPPERRFYQASQDKTYNELMG